MRFSFPLAFLVLGTLPAARVQGSSLDAIALLPSCAVQCLIAAADHSTCGLTNQTCMCTSIPFQDDMTTCVMSNCTVRQSLNTKNITETICNAPIRNETKSLTNVATILGIITGVVVLGRLVFKLFVVKTGLTWDDWFILLATICGIPNTTIAIHGVVANGLGRDIWTLTDDKITKFGLFFYVMEVNYFLEVALLKTSILLFYLRIFPTTWTRRVLWATVAFNALFGLACVLAGIFQCQPISYYWTKWDGEHSGRCIDVNGLGWANAIVSIVLDLWMLGIPLSQLPKLRLHWKRKIGVALMFCVGTFVTVVSVLRLQSLVSFANSQNPTWDNKEVSNWSVVEINVGIMCACMPTARLALVRAFHVFRETTIRTNGYYGYRNQERSAQGRGGGTGTRTGDGQHNRSRTGRNVSATASSSAGTIKSTTPGGTIVCQKSYAVQYSDHDDTNSVYLRDLEDSASKASGRVRSESFA